MGDSRALFLQGIPASANLFDLESDIATILHGPPVSGVHPGSSLPLNFEINFFKPGRSARLRNNASFKSGTLFIPILDVAQRFLQHVQRYRIQARGQPLTIKVDTNPRNRPTEQLISALLSEPYQGKQAVQRREQIDSLATIKDAQVQLGVRTRDGAFEPHVDIVGRGLARSCSLCVDGEKAVLRIQLEEPTERLTHISIRFGNIEAIYLDKGSGSQQSLLLRLQQPAMLEGTSARPAAIPSDLSAFMQAVLMLDDKPSRVRLSSISSSVTNQLPYILRDLRIYCPKKGPVDLYDFVYRLAELFHLRAPVRIGIRLSQQQTYSSDLLRRADDEMAGLPPAVAFLTQVSAVGPYRDLY